MYIKYRPTQVVQKTLIKLIYLKIPNYLKKYQQTKYVKLREVKHVPHGHINDRQGTKVNIQI